MKGKNLLKITILLTYFFISFNSYSQEILVGKILNEIETTKKDEKKLENYNLLSDFYFYTMTDSAIFYCEKALKIAKKINNNAKLSSVYKNIGVLYFIKGNIDSSLYFYYQGLEKCDNKLDSADFLLNIGTSLIQKGEYKKAFENIDIAESTFREIQNQKNHKNKLIFLLVNTGVIYSQQGLNKKAIETYLEVLKFGGDSIDMETQGIINQNLGTIFGSQKDFNKAEEYFNQAYDIYLKLNSVTYICDILINLSIINLDKKNYQKADSLLNVVLKMSELAHLENKKAKVLTNFGRLNEEQKKHEIAIKFYNQSLEISLNQKLDFDILINYLALASIYNDIKNYIKAEYFGKLALEKSDKLETLEMKSETYKILSEIYANNKDFENAYKYSQTYKLLNDSIFGIQKVKAIFELEMTYQTDKKQKEIQLLKYEKEIQANKMNKNKRQFLLIIFTIFVGSILIFIVQRLIRQKQKFQENKKIINTAIETEERIKDTIARELHDNIGGTLASIISQANSENFVNENLKNIKLVYNDVRNLSHSLSEPMFIDVNVSEKLSAFVLEISQNQKININFYDSISLKWNKINQNQEIQKAIYRIVQEMITNTLKHSKATEVEIEIIDFENNINLIYTDNGVGFDQNNFKHGIGLQNIFKRLDALNGKCEISSTLGEGVTFSIDIPFSQI